MNLKKTVLSTAVASALCGALATPASAAILEFSYDGLFTMLDPSGIQLQNTSNPYYSDPTWGYGLRTQISGTMQFDTDTGAGFGTVNPFEFFNGGPAVAEGVVFQSQATPSDPTNPLLVGNMLFNWGVDANGDPNAPITTEIVLDASGLFAALNMGLFAGPGSTVDTTTCGTGGALDGFCALPASDGIKKGKYPIGPSPIATSSFNTDGVTVGVDDGIGGSPMDNGPFVDFNANFDMTSVVMCATCYTDATTPEVPVPAAVWLFGSGLLGLVGVARRRKQA